MVVFRRDDDEGVGASHLGGEGWVFGGFTSVVGAEWERGDVDEFGFDVGAFGKFGYQETGGIGAAAAFADSAEDDGNVEGAGFRGQRRTSAAEAALEKDTSMQR
jgi:hypothetical protein